MQELNKQFCKDVEAGGLRNRQGGRVSLQVGVWAPRGRAGSGKWAETGDPGTRASEIGHTGPFLCVGRCSESPSDVAHWCSHWILEMGVALSPFACEGTMAPLGRHSERGPHRRMLAGPGSWGGRWGLPWNPQLRQPGGGMGAYAEELGTRRKTAGVHTKKGE